MSEQYTRSIAETLGALNLGAFKPSKPPKWLIDIDVDATDGRLQYVAKRLDHDMRGQRPYYDRYCTFPTPELAEAFIRENFHYPVHYSEPPQ